MIMQYRVGPWQSLVVDYGYVVQRKVWYGWKTIGFYYEAGDAVYHGKSLVSKGHNVKFYI